MLGVESRTGTKSLRNFRAISASCIARLVRIPGHSSWSQSAEYSQLKKLSLYSRCSSHLSLKIFENALPRQMVPREWEANRHQMMLDLADVCLLVVVNYIAIHKVLCWPLIGIWDLAGRHDGPAAFSTLGVQFLISPPKYLLLSVFGFAMCRILHSHRDLAQRPSAIEFVTEGRWSYHVEIHLLVALCTSRESLVADLRLLPSHLTESGYGSKSDVASLSLLVLSSVSYLHGSEWTTPR